MQEMPTPHTMSYPNHNRRGATRSIPDSSDPGFVHSSGDPSKSPSYKTTKDPSPVPISNLSSVRIGTTTNDPSHVTN